MPARPLKRLPSTPGKPRKQKRGQNYFFVQMNSPDAGGTVDLAGAIIPYRSTHSQDRRCCRATRGIPNTHPIGTPPDFPQSSRGSATPTILRKRFARWTANSGEFPGPPASLARQRPGRARGGRLLSLRDPDDFPNQPTRVPTPTPENRRGHPARHCPKKSLIQGATGKQPLDELASRSKLTIFEEVLLQDSIDPGRTMRSNAPTPSLQFTNIDNEKPLTF